VAEFELINQYFRSIAIQRDDVRLGIGDDCAVMELPAGCQLAMSTDTLVAGVHFPQLTSAEDIGYKALAANLSDLAAMGATPAWASLSLTLPEDDHDWLSRFSRGFAELLQRYNIQLVGGDTTRGPLSITVTVCGFLTRDKALRRDAAKPGELIFVTGTIGDAGIGLKKILASIDYQGSLQHCVSRLNRPTPRVELAMALTAVSACAIDISDGLFADLGHITQQSGCGARLQLENIPLSSELQQYYGPAVDWQQVIGDGDDYELCFTLAADNRAVLDDLARQTATRVTCIGEITADTGIECILPDGSRLSVLGGGYNHFSD